MENRIGPSLSVWPQSVSGEATGRYAQREYQATPTAVAPNPLKQAKNSELIHEMLERGYAVMKVPESGTPDALK